MFHLYQGVLKDNGDMDLLVHDTKNNRGYFLAYKGHEMDWGEFQEGTGCMWKSLDISKDLNEYFISWEIIYSSDYKGIKSYLSMNKMLLG
ncbi:hypothetical protein PYDG_00016 [Pseudoalteromonas phage pYD6-A]|uniref:Uncharacterized protein n=1 Tax=Pseudoalteromonas phage pYD6-A TaxID=754052 RepID=M4SNC8_9CAUD|nr:hypothetical protein PYDG_00016 [Pseudoalteromonas phage pYD6-A]AGH57548.1 hypothetical protein PYDG_00016 [Pseudoalteromonas phage pYD6-A]